MAEPKPLLCFRVSDSALLPGSTREFDSIFLARKANDTRQKHLVSRKARREISELEQPLSSRQDARASAGEISLLENQLKLKFTWYYSANIQRVSHDKMNSVTNTVPTNAVRSTATSIPRNSRSPILLRGNFFVPPLC